MDQENQEVELKVEMTRRSSSCGSPTAIGSSVALACGSRLENEPKPKSGSFHHQSEHGGDSQTKREKSSDRDRDGLLDQNLLSPKKRNIDVSYRKVGGSSSGRSSISNSSSNSTSSVNSSALKPLDQSQILNHCNTSYNNSSNSHSNEQRDRPRNNLAQVLSSRKSSLEVKDQEANQEVAVEQEKQEQSVTLLDLVWEDILFVYCLPRLNWEDLFHLRQLSTRSSALVSGFFAQLKRLDLSDVTSKFNEIAFKVVTENCTILRQVTITGASWIKDAELSRLFRSNKFITYVDLSGCRGLNGSCLLSLSVHCKLVTTLHLRDCTWMSRGAVETLMAHLRRLQQVDFTSCAALSNNQIIPFTQVFPRLTRLHLAHIQAVNDMTLIMIARNCRDILHLDVRSCMCVTDHGIRALAEYCPKLKSLNINNCHLVTEYSLQLIRSRGTVSIDRPCAPFLMDMPVVPIPRVQV